GVDSRLGSQWSRMGAELRRLATVAKVGLRLMGARSLPGEDRREFLRACAALEEGGSHFVYLDPDTGLHF
ncbi:MAG TPA: hypothetical protein VM715_01340, partial [Candidatus Acidoferrum sp.]|nr:hypothetical protein [Candidatus Acidoferrum sp.]